MEVEKPKKKRGKTKKNHTKIKNTNTLSNNMVIKLNHTNEEDTMPSGMITFVLMKQMIIVDLCWCLPARNGIWFTTKIQHGIFTLMVIYNG